MRVDAWDLVKAQQWAITDEYLKVIAQVALRENSVEEYEALQAKRGRPLANAYRVTRRGETENVAVIPITGPIFPRANLFTWLSGATSAEIVAQDLRTALDDKSVDAIILDIDSPGGAVAGVNELSGLIYEARHQKPVIAYASYQMASAAYWIGSAARSIVTERTGVLGSIGVVSRIEDTSGAEEKRGVRTFTVVSNVSPNKVLDPKVDAHRAQIQRMVDDMAQVFVETVARNRGVPVENVIRDYGQGGTFLGDAAVAAGMAERIGSLEPLIAELSAEGRADHYRRIFDMARGPITIKNTAELRAALTSGHTGEEITVAEVDTKKIEADARAAGVTEGRAAAEAETSAAVEKARTEASADAVKAERARIAGINAIVLPGFEKEAQAAIENGKTPEAFALEQSAAQRDRGTSRQQQIKDAPRAIGHGGAPEGGDGARSQSDIDAMYDKAHKRLSPAITGKR